MALNLKKMSIFDVSDIHELNLFIKKGGDVNEVNWRGETALYFEEFINNYEMLKCLLEAGISTNHNSARAFEPPVFQVTQKDCLELMMQYKMDINVQDSEGCPLGHYFASDASMLEILLINHYDINLTDENGENILFRDDLSEEAGLMAIEAGINIFQKNENDETALFHITDHIVAKELIRRGLSVNDLNNENSTPLLTNPQSQCCKVFIESGANVNHINDDGDNALTIKSYFGINKIKLMTEYGIDINHCNSQGENIAFLTKDKDSVEYIIDNGLEIEHKNKSGNNVLEETISLELAKIFVKAGISINDNINRYSEPIREYLKEELSKIQKNILTQSVAVFDEPTKHNPRI